MGKSDKKIKPDRIAALRKQYEEFLEQDKKRKERNEFILGRMDNMRSNSLVPVKQVETHQERPLYRPAPIYQGSLLKKPKGNELQNIGNQQNIAVNLNSAGSALLEEIGKKYILIPRSITAVTEYTSEAKVKDVTAENDSNDWKSKYHILDELKRADKEGLEPNSKNDNIPIKEHQLSFTSQNIDTLVQETDQDQEPKLKYKEEVQEKEIIYKRSDYGIHNYPEKSLDSRENKYAVQNNDQDSELSVNNYPENLYETQNIAEKEMESIKAVNSYTPLYSSETEFGYGVTDLKTNINEDFTTKDTNSSNPINTPIRDATATTSNEEANTDNAGFQDIVNPQVTFEPHEGKGKDVRKGDYRIDNQNVVQGLKNHNEQYPIEAINTLEYTPNEGVILKDSVSSHLEGYMLNENYVNPSITNASDSELATVETVPRPELTTETVAQLESSKQSEVPLPINEAYTEAPVVQNFDTEQIQEFEEEANMFYQEPDAAYDQTNGDTDYAQNQNEPNQYYEGVEQEQYNPVEIDEHEEATERYDPSYQAQYEQGQYDYTQQGYEQQGHEQQGYAEQDYGQSVQEYTAPQDQFEEPVSDYSVNQYPKQYDETMCYDVPQEQGYDVVVEQQLDQEQGYIETEHEQTLNEQPENKAVEQEDHVQQNA